MRFVNVTTIYKGEAAPQVAHIINLVPSVILTRHQLKPSILHLNYPQHRWLYVMQEIVRTCCACDERWSR
ncbi:hypothetical protein NIES4071_72670 [Calothrix sp. NIES-4071]|nr:hypothetical protein NIES4071_72670 [Calothrix sp. NIES-4071]BAZ61542.1 hypothetical protein NIES4105_72620 [Calothrix sp. NIES-4105]